LDPQLELETLPPQQDMNHNLYTPLLNESPVIISPVTPRRMSYCQKLMKVTGDYLRHHPFLFLF